MEFRIPYVDSEVVDIVYIDADQLDGPEMCLFAAYVEGKVVNVLSNASVANLRERFPICSFIGVSELKLADMDEEEWGDRIVR